MIESEAITSELAKLELQELETSDKNNIEQIYIGLLILYLIKQDLLKCKFLFKRMPDAIKTHQDTKILHTIYLKLLQNEFSDIVQSMEFHHWTFVDAHYQQMLKESIIHYIIGVVSKVYSSIPLLTISNWLNMAPNALASYSLKINWNYTLNNEMLVPNSTEMTENNTIDNSKHIKSLVNYITFFEN